MSTLFIQDTTLTAIANAIRTKSGGGEIVPIVEIFKSDNVNTPEDYTPGAPTGTFYQVVKIEGASELLVKLWLEFNVPNASNFMMKAGEHEQGSWNYSSADYQRNGVLGTVTYEMFSFKDTDAVSLYAYSAGTANNGFGWYVEVEGYDADGNVIGEGSGTPLTYTPLEMPAAILAISGESGGGITPEGELEILENGDYDVTTYASAHVSVPVGVFPEGTFEITENGEYSVTTYDKVSVDVASSGGDIEVEPIVLTGIQPYGCSGAISGKYIELFGDTITTNKLLQTSNMFENSTLTRIPFSLNYDNTTYRTMPRMFANCYNLVEVPVMTNVYPDNITGFFAHCHCLRELPENFGADWNWSRLQGYVYGYMNNILENCYSLRKIPTSFLSNLWGIHTSAYYAPTYYTFSNCYTLDEVRGFPVQPATLTSNLFAGFVNSCYRLEALTFATNEDGSPKTANWKSQVIEFTYVGYLTGLTSNITDYNSGITTATQVTDDATYQALKNNPDWWTANVNYSRYNHDSAVETINSLPDCSASGGTNTIKFKGAAGSSTDGGAINTMTEAEIAVAAAKGWTVTFV